MDSYIFLFNAFTLTANGVLQLFFLGKITEKHVKAKQLSACLVLLYGTGFMALAAGIQYADIPLNILVLYVMGRLGLKNGRAISCVTAVLAVYITQFSFGIVNSFTMLFFPGLPWYTPLLYLAAVFAALLSLALCGICYRVVTRCITLQKCPQSMLIWMLLPPGLFLFAAELYILSVNYGSLEVMPGQLAAGKHLALLILQALGAGALFSSLYAYRRTCDGFKAQAALVSMEQEIHAQKNYVSQARMRYENTRAFRHDIKNHLSVLDGFLRDGSIEQARDYLRKLDAAAGRLSFPVHTGNPTVDILLGDKLELAGRDGTKFEISFLLPKDCAITDLDWCIIFSNALDNAIRACRQVSAFRCIRISGEQQGCFYMLEFENSCPEDQTIPPDFGIGLGNIKNVAENYGGAIAMDCHNGLFRLNILLNISGNSSIHQESIS